MAIILPDKPSTPPHAHYKAGIPQKKRRKDGAPRWLASRRVGGCGGESAGFEEGGDQGQGQADYVEVVAFDAGDPAGGAALDGVGSCFVHGLAGGDVGGDLFVGEGEEFDGGDFGGYFGGLGSDDGDAGDDAMGAAGEQAQHGGGVALVFGFGEDVVVEGYGGVGAEDGQAARLRLGLGCGGICGSWGDFCKASLRG